MDRAMTSADENMGRREKAGLGPRSQLDCTAAREQSIRQYGTLGFGPHALAMPLTHDNDPVTQRSRDTTIL
jgi:hypothetical protein